MTAEECPRIPPEFLEEERATMGNRWFRREYLCEFEDAVSGVSTVNWWSARSRTR